MLDPTAIGFYLLAITAGISFVFQQAVNSSLRAELGSPLWAGVISYIGGTLAMLAAVAALRDPLPSLATIARSSPVSWLGGLFGAVYIGVSIVLLPRLGAATVLALLVLGQMLGSVAFDHFAVLGIPEHPVSPLRLVGIMLIVGGVVLIRAF